MNIHTHTLYVCIKLKLMKMKCAINSFNREDDLIQFWHLFRWQLRNISWDMMALLSVFLTAKYTYLEGESLCRWSSANSMPNYSFYSGWPIHQLPEKQRGNQKSFFLVAKLEMPVFIQWTIIFRSLKDILEMINHSQSNQNVCFAARAKRGGHCETNGKKAIKCSLWMLSLFSDGNAKFYE